MKRYLWIYILLLLFVLPQDSFSQRWKLKRYEAGIGLGSSNSWTDIGLRGNFLGGFQFIGTRPSLVTNVRYTISPLFAATLNLNYAMLGGQNIEIDDRYLIYYNTQTFEPSLQMEFYLINSIMSKGTTALFNKKGMVNNYNNMAVYLFGGVGTIFYKPSVKMLDNSSDLPPGVNTNSGAAFVFPLGLGMKYTIDAYWVLGLEIGLHYTLTDLLDGYSSQYSNFNDLYYLTSIKAIYKIRTGRNGLPVFKRYAR